MKTTTTSPSVGSRVPRDRHAPLSAPVPFGRARRPRRAAPLAAALLLLAGGSQFTATAPAAVPHRWTVEASRVAVEQIEAFRGEGIDLEASLNAYGKPLELPSSADYFLYWQTNGMGTAYWVTNAALSASNVLSAAFRPEFAPAAGSVRGFVGSPDSSYRAAFTIRFRDAPGATPNELPVPTAAIDFAKVTVYNPPYYTKAETDAKISAATPADYATVANLASNAAPKSALGDYALKSSLSSLAPLSSLTSHTNDTSNPHKVTAAQVGAYSKSEIDAKGYLTEHQSLDAYALKSSLSSLAPLSSLASHTNDTSNPHKVTATQVGAITAETDPTVPAWAKASAKPTYTASEVGAVPTTRTVNSKALSADITLGAADVGAYSSGDGTALAKRVTQTEGDVGVLTAYVSGTDTSLTITNYNASTEMPAAELAVKMDDAATNASVLTTVWRELTRWARFLGVADVPLLDWGFSGVTNLQGFVNAAIDELDAKSPKEYAFFDGVTGNPSPDGVFQISMPRVLICAGAAYQRYGDTAGGYWVLESNGLVADINGTTNGYFRISDDEGNAQFEIVKGDRQPVVATAKTMTSSVMDVTHFFTSYCVTNAVAAPTAYFSRTIQSPEWVAEGDDCFFNTSWTGPVDNVYTLEWWPKSADEKVAFLKVSYDRGGVTRIVNTAPVQMQTLIVNGVTYALGTATIDGNTVLTLTPATTTE